MTHTANWVFAAAVLTGFGPAMAGTFTLVPEVPGSDTLGTSSLAINDTGVIGGSYSTAGGTLLHGFIGDQSGVYTTFDYQAAGFTAVYTYVRNINNSGTAVGHAQDAAGNIRQYKRTSDGTITTLINPATGLPLDWVAAGINQAGSIVGSYDTGGTFAGYILSPDGSSLTTLTDPLAQAGVTHARGINDNGKVVGFYRSSPGVTSGFVYDIASSTFTTLNDPLGVKGTTLVDINDSGAIAGQFLDAGNQSHGFVYDPATSTFTTLDAPGATQTQAFQINAAGQVAISSDAGAYIYSPVPDAPTQSLFGVGLLAVAATIRRRRVQATASPQS